MYKRNPHKSHKNPRVMGLQDWGLDRQPDLSAQGVGHPFGIIREVRHPILVNQKYPHQYMWDLLDFLCWNVARVYHLEKIHILINLKSPIRKRLACTWDRERDVEKKKAFVLIDFEEECFSLLNLFHLRKIHVLVRAFTAVEVYCYIAKI